MQRRILVFLSLMLAFSPLSLADEGVKRQLRLDPVYFGGNGTAVMTQNEEPLGQIIKMMGQAPAMHFLISGYSDGAGSAKAQRTMAQRRARTIKAYLVDRGIDAARLDTQGVVTGDGEGSRVETHSEDYWKAPVEFTAQGAFSATLGIYAAPIQVLNFVADDYSYIGAAKIGAEYDFGFIPLELMMDFVAGGGGAGYVEFAVGARYAVLEQDSYSLAPYLKLGLLHAWQTETPFAGSSLEQTLSGSGFLIGAGATFDYALMEAMGMPFFVRGQAGFQYGAVAKGAMAAGAFNQASAQSIGLTMEAALGYTF